MERKHLPNRMLTSDKKPTGERDLLDGAEKELKAPNRQGESMQDITNTQKTLIHIGIADLGIDDTTYRLMLSQYGVDTCKDLQYSQASALIDDLVKKGFKIKRRRPAGRRVPASNVVFLPTRQQLGMIEHLRADITWRVHDGYHRWIQKFLGRTYIKNEKEAQKVIEALKGMKRRQYAPGNWGSRQKVQ